ncbi:DHHA1 domain-containing protein [Sulfobacillus thermosulfidooxidans]|uniref:DHHA1 domain-containing protein n=1 Tax=Sulfobacillus thermosulfidooxidans TaxID=28034 RepID=UPI0006B683AA|nr:DHHA1 domain-containing protein [Sulfobacillus thermosulfidooxidans]
MASVLVTHNHCLDGCLAATLGIVAGVVDQVELVDYSHNDATVQRVIQSPDVDRVFVVDMSVGEATAQVLDTWPHAVVVLDHHRTALPLNQWAWATVDPSRCGAALFFEYLVNQGWGDRIQAHRDLVAIVNDYDLWIRRDPRSDDLALLLDAFGPHWMIAAWKDAPAFVQAFWGDDPDALAGSAMVEALRQQRQTYLERCAATLRRVSGESGETLVVVVAERHHSELGELLAHRPGVDAVVILDPLARKVSLRSRGSFDVSALAQRFGGGGHPGAAGIPQSQTPRFVRWLSERMGDPEGVGWL